MWMIEDHSFLGQYQSQRHAFIVISEENHLYLQCHLGISLIVCPVTCYSLIHGFNPSHHIQSLSVYQITVTDSDKRILWLCIMGLYWLCVLERDDSRMRQFWWIWKIQNLWLLCWTATRRMIYYTVCVWGGGVGGVCVCVYVCVCLQIRLSSMIFLPLSKSSWFSSYILYSFIQNNIHSFI